MPNLTQSLADRLTAAVGQEIYGKEDTVRRVICAMLAGGHILLEDVPGTGKTSLVRSLSAAFGGDCRRVQFTPDLLPSDITGIHFYNQATGEFPLRKGPIFTNLFLADEINRATPRTQSALLECMEEGQVTLDGETLPLDDIFMVMATMNPLEYQGTFPLPEAQIDRFMMKLHMGYPSEENEQGIVDRICGAAHQHSAAPVATPADIRAARAEMDAVRISPAVKTYIVSLVRATREHEQVRLGAGPRGVVAITRASRAWAAMQGRDHVLPDDIKALAVPVLAHRLLLRSQSSVQLTRSTEAVVEYLLSHVTVPLE